MEIDTHPDDTEVLLDWGLCAARGRGGPLGLLGACSIAWHEFVLGKQTPVAIISIYNTNPEMEMGQHKPCGLTGEVGTHDARDRVLCP